MRRISIEEAQAGMAVGQAILAEDGEVLVHADVELTPRFIASLQTRGYTSLVIDDEVTQGIDVPETISSEVRANTARKLRETFSSFAMASEDLKGRSTRQIAKGLESTTFASQARRIDPYEAMLSRVQAMMDDLMTVEVVDGLNAVKI